MYSMCHSVWILEPTCHIDNIVGCINIGWTKYDATWLGREMHRPPLSSRGNCAFCDITKVMSLKPRFNMFLEASGELFCVCDPFVEAYV